MKGIRCTVFAVIFKRFLKGLKFRPLMMLLMLFMSWNRVIFKIIKEIFVDIVVICTFLISSAILKQIFFGWPFFPGKRLFILLYCLLEYFPLFYSLFFTFCIGITILKAIPLRLFSVLSFYNLRLLLYLLIVQVVEVVVEVIHFVLMCWVGLEKVICL